MLREGKNIDAVFREGLSEHEVVPEGYVWDSLEKSLASQRKQRKVLVIWRSLAAACIAGFIALAIGWLFRVSEPLTSSEVQLVENDKIENEMPLQTAGFTEQVVEKKTIVEDAKSEPVSLIESNLLQPKKVTVAVNEKKTVGAAGALDYLSSNSSLQLTENYDIDRQLHNRQEKVYYPIYAYNSTPVPEKKKATVSVGGLLSPAYNSKVSYGAPARNVLKSGGSINESGINSLGGGLQVRVNTGSRWSFETGVLYSQVGQSVKNAQSTTFANVREGVISPNTATANSLGEIVINKASEDFSRAQVYANDIESAVLNYDNSYNSVKQTLDYIEVPLMARYALFNSFPYLSVSGGFSSNFLVNNSAYAVSGSSKEKIGETSDIKSFVISSSLGVGVDVPITKTIRLSLEPRFKYFLNSVSSNELNSFQPYSFGVYGGLTFVVN
ncbi:PorT family protein [Carboxylicivirga mesophila]|uniref:PorT family protein n=1 Tax=Carboxylicivirga mesophila TaxID=1166478 RepID=A0ABS5K8C8_9BACT|nr:porin family protein [Carboxylicivirga mesophila]MBS2211142.1 PorT family protein [Carboxylicivirga mesophila]